MKQAKQIFQSSLFLTATSLLIRTLGVWFQITLTGVAGSEAMGLYALLLGVYGFALTVATSGIHLGVTRMVAETVSRGQTFLVPTVMKKAFRYALFFGLLSAGLLFFFAPTIGNGWMHDARAIAPLRLLSVSLPLISLCSLFNGYFTAVHRVTKPALVQVAEQILRILLSMQLVNLSEEKSAEAVCFFIVLGGVASDALSFFVQGGFYLFDRRRHFPASGSSVHDRSGRKLLQISLPIALTAYVRSGLITFEHILIPLGLKQSGSSHASALIAYAGIHSMALPILLYPAALISAFSGQLIPSMAEYRVQDRQNGIRYRIGRVWEFALYYSIGVAGVMICFSDLLGEALYPGAEIGRYLRILAPLIPIMYADTATDAMLKGLGEQLWSMKVNIADAGISVLLVWLLIPKYGINGYLVAIWVSETFNTVFSVSRLLAVGKAKVRPFKWVYFPLLCVLGATFLISRLLPIFQPTGRTWVILWCFVTFALYWLFLLPIGCVGREERAWIKTLFLKGTVCETDAPPLPREVSREEASYPPRENAAS